MCSMISKCMFSNFALFKLARSFLLEDLGFEYFRFVLRHLCFVEHLPYVYRGINRLQEESKG